MIIEQFGMRLATMGDLAKELGVKPNQVSMWSQRRERNGFPEPVMRGDARNGVKDAAWFDVDEVLEWRANYVPGKGGYQAHRARRAS